MVVKKAAAAETTKVAPGFEHAPHGRSRAGLESEDAFDPPTPEDLMNRR